MRRQASPAALRAAPSRDGRGKGRARGAGRARGLSTRRAATAGTARALAVFAAIAAALGVAGAAHAEAAADPGARAFQKCFACHSVDPKERGLPGPNLARVVGRPAAALADFAYSKAMLAARRKNVVWTEATLDRFLADPQAVVPGTAMEFFGLRSSVERAAVIAYLARKRP